MKEKRNKIVIALILSLSTQGLLSTELLKIEQVQEKNIEYNAKQVGQLLFKHRIARISLTAVSSIVHLMEFYRCCQFFL